MHTYYCWTIHFGKWYYFGSTYRAYAGAEFFELRDELEANDGA